MTPIDEPRPVVPAATHAARDAAPASPTPSVDAAASAARYGGLRVALLFAVALALCLLAYVALTAPAGWAPRAAPKAWGAEALTVTRGSGQVADGELVIGAADPTGMTIVSVVTQIRSADYPAVSWAAIGIPESANASLLWSNDYAPQTLNSLPLRIEAGRPLPALPKQDQGWVGNITGLALAIQGPLPQPVRIRGVVAKPMGAVEILGDRAREWFAFDGWTGTSINTVEGGADVQVLSLPALLAAAVALAAGAAWLLRRVAPRWFPPVATTLVALFVAASWLLDARWTWNLGRQVRATAAQFAGMDIRERHLAEEDGPLYAFVEKARQKLPPTGARVYVVADAPYFRDRAAYHLYPHNVYFDPLTNAIPPASALRPGDWLVAYQRRGLQYSPAEERLRWEGGQSVAAELALVDGFGALFRIR